MCFISLSLFNYDPPGSEWKSRFLDDNFNLLLCNFERREECRIAILARSIESAYVFDLDKVSSPISQTSATPRPNHNPQSNQSPRSV